MEWREKEPGEWWLVFEDAPPLGERDANGVGYPPTLSLTFPADENGHKLDTGCFHLWSWFNGEQPGEEGTDPDYLHICDLDEFIADLQAVRDLTLPDIEATD